MEDPGHTLVVRSARVAEDDSRHAPADERVAAVRHHTEDTRHGLARPLRH